MKRKTFRLEEIDEKFWEKVLLINIWRSSGLGGPGGMWFVTSDKNVYFISFETFPYSEHNLGAFNPIFNRKRDNKSKKVIFEAENRGWKYIENENTFVRDYFYDNFIKVYDKKKDELGQQWHYMKHMPDIAAEALGMGDAKLERFDEVEFWKLLQKNIEEAAKCEIARRKIALTAKDFNWSKIYANNDPQTGFEFGEYAMIFKEYEGKVKGYKFSVIYQREETSPLLMKGINAKIERYNLFETKYDDVQGSLTVGESIIRDDYWYTMDKTNTLNDYSVNSHGEFIRSFETMEDAKEYLVGFVNSRGYVDKKNIITDLDNKERVYRNWKRKYEGIIAFRKYCNEIIEFICEYDYPSKTSGGGKYIYDAIKEKLGIDDELLEEMIQYFPMELNKRIQEKAVNMVDECNKHLN